MEFKLPEIGEGVQEGELIRWLVKDGDAVQADQPLLEVMTDKATVEVPAPVAGKIQGLQAKDGDMIKVGQTLAQIDEAAAGKPAEAAPPAPAPAQAPQAAPQAPAPQAQPAAPQGASASPKAAPAPAPAQQASFAPSAGGSVEYVGALEAHAPSSVPAAPIVRAMAQRAGVDLSQVAGSGPAVGGVNRVLEEDLIRFLNNKQSGNGARPALTGFAAPSEETERKPLRGLRRVISNAMVKSKFTIPHYSYVDEFECSELVELREEAKKLGEKMGAKISYLPFIVKAVVGALKEYPVVNSSLEDKPDGSQEVVYKKFFHIGIAVATEQGLVVPVIKHADKKSLLDIAKEMVDLSNRARAGKASGDELKGSTFTITSMGNVGGLFATPIINYPEAGIMGVYKVQEKPLVKNGQIVIGKTMHLSLSLDHRIVDGTIGAEFCNAVIARLQNPARLLLEMI
jgi:pyruvate dehydrogenase E2 component (dihydrolipoamide acetyltransferase)